MSQRIVMTSSKGGTGKTTTALNLAVALAERGRRTLLVDLDPQGAIGLFLAKDDIGWGGLAEVLVRGSGAREVVVSTNLPTLRILPRGRLDPVDVCEYERRLWETATLEAALDELDDDFDYLLLDTPSGLGPVTRSALRISQWAIVPLQAEPVALRAIHQTLRVLTHVQREENASLRLLGILPTMVQLGQEASLNVMGAVWSGFGGVFDTVVPRADAFGMASEVGVPVAFLGGPMPPEARRFALLADEVESRIHGTTGGQDEHEVRRLV